MIPSIVLTNGRIHTLDPTRPIAEAIAIHQDRILAIGTDTEIKPLIAAGSDWIDLKGRCVTPGLVDAHVHFQHFALSLQTVDLDGAGSRAEALERVRDFVQKEKDHSGIWLRGRGWSQDAWPNRQFPTAADLDAILPDRPVFLAHKSGHAAWVNSVALRLGHIDRHSIDPPGGQIRRDAAGQPTGILFEDAIDLIARQIPRPTTTEIVPAMRQAQAYCWQAGLTGIHDFDGRDCFRALQWLLENDELGLRVVKNIPAYRLEHALGVGLRSGFGNDWLRIGGVKFFADGALGSRTAAMLASYEGEPDNRGIVVTDKEELLERGREAVQGGLSLTVHAIGDRANHDVLDVFELIGQERDKNKRPRTQHRIEHVQVLHPDDRHRPADLNIIASMQPIHATSDMDMADRYWGERARFSYAWRTMLDSGTTLVFGSDAPVEKIDPLPGIYAAVTRRRADGQPGPDGWYPEQRLTMLETIKAFTTAAAVTSGQSHSLGTLAPGKLADLTIFDRDLFTIPADEIPSVAIAATMVGGIFRHRTW
jgi:predicted amidohydrolase YtcJ